MVALDLTIVTVALPRIQPALHFSGSNLEWVINAYVVAFGGPLLLGGPIRRPASGRKELKAYAESRGRWDHQECGISGSVALRGRGWRLGRGGGPSGLV
jgi:MFS family permease